MHFHAHLTRAEVCLTQARCIFLRSEDPTAPIHEGAAAIQAGLKLNPTDFRLHHLRALLELMASRHALFQGHSPIEAVSRSEAAARRGLSFKSDSTSLWLALARAQRYRAEWALKQGESAAPWIAEGLRDLQRALALDPTLGESLAERASLEGLQAGNRKEAQDKLGACLKRNRFLALDFRPS